jgi:hypothetical protein
LYSVYYELTTSACFKHYVLIFRRGYTNSNWCFSCVLCLLTATGIGEELQRDALFLVYYELTASTCFDKYLLIFRRRYTNSNWYFMCVLCRLAATKIGVELPYHTNLARKIPIIVCEAPPEDKQVVIETCRDR